MESRTAALEDVLYQKGASFSATLDETNGHVMDNSIDNDVPNDPSTAPAQRQTRKDTNNVHALPAPSREYFDSLVTGTATNGIDMFYSSKDMSIFDDVNNNRLNLPVINDRFTVRQAPQLPVPSEEGLNTLATQDEQPPSTTSTTTIGTPPSPVGNIDNGGNINETHKTGLNKSPVPVTTA